MYFRIILSRTHGALTYLLADAGEAVVVDPLPGSDVLLLAMLAEHRLRLRYVLHTHLHHQGDSCAHALARQCGATLAVGERIDWIGGALRLADGEALGFGREWLRVLLTPGHTGGCTSYRWRDRLFCGDTLDIGGCATGDAEADAGVLCDTLVRRVFVLPDETLLHPAHAIKGRCVSMVFEERARYARRGGVSRESLLSEIARRGGGHDPFAPDR